MLDPELALIIPGIKPPFSRVLIAPDGRRTHAIFSSVGQGEAARNALGDLLLRMAEQGHPNVTFNTDREKHWVTAQTTDETTALLKTLLELGYIASWPAHLVCTPRSAERQRLESISIIFPSPETPDAPAFAKATLRNDVPPETMERILAASNHMAKSKELPLAFTLSRDGHSLIAEMPYPEQDIAGVVEVLYGMGGVLSFEGRNNILRLVPPHIAPTTHIAHPGSLAIPLMRAAGQSV